MEHLKVAQFGSAPALLTNIRLGYRGLPGTNTLAYEEKSKIMDRNCYITLGPGVYRTKLFLHIFTYSFCKLDLFIQSTNIEYVDKKSYLSKSE